MSREHAQQLITRLKSLKPTLHNKDFLLTWQQSDENLRALLLVAETLENLHIGNVSTRVFDSGLAVSNFRDQSTRTRFSYAKAANLLGLTSCDLDESKSQIAHGETVRETANMISFTTETIGIRDDIFLGHGHQYMKEVSEAVEEGFRENVLAQRPAVINLQCDLDHPTQSMSDLLHLQKEFGSLENLRGKKIAMTWAYSPSYGKPLSVPQAIICLMTRFGMDVTLAHPEGYGLVPETIEKSHAFAKESGGSFTQTDNMAGAFADADIVYPKSWAPFDVMKERTELLKSGNNAGLGDLEKRCLENNKRFVDWQCTEDLMKKTKDEKALYMHCLPADITGVSCETGEVEGSVFKRYRLATYREASHKPFVIAAMMLLTRVEKPADLLASLCENPRNRRPG